MFILALSLAAASAQPNQRIAKAPKVTYDWLPGFVSITELTAAPGLGKTSDPLSKYYYGITTIAGYQFSRNIKAGVGAGVQIHNEGTLFPLFLDARYNLNSQVLIPYVSAAGGIALDINVLEETRVFINPSVGVRYVAARRACLVFSTGLMVTTGGPDARKSFVNFKLGVELKTKR